MDEIGVAEEMIDQMIFYIIDGCTHCPYFEYVGRKKICTYPSEGFDCTEVIKEYFK